ncbi:hypothetical protein POKO110462_13365 [Pontibacter korlensis]|uniref:Uncharacterized protein n=1 Tax=Pontibacter korlensis TaxID=400092 RepID=A0A0E3UYA7_9BACT|nr:hypothetical protein [Pontibacter korlensis]AKD04286.1 hypothetical protein PKOR_15815 [Pontibacter korlensis]
MKNQNLKLALARFNALNDVEPLEGTVIRAVRGGLAAPCTTKCGTNSACNSNEKEVEEELKPVG